METLPRTPVQVWEFIFLYILDVKSRLNPIFYHFIYSLLFHEAHTIQGDAGLDPQFQALPRTPAQVFFNLVPGYSWCGGAVGMFFILNYFFPIDRSSSALFVAQKTEALSTWWEPFPGPLCRSELQFSSIFLMSSQGWTQFLLHFIFIISFSSWGAHHSRRRWTWSTVPGPPQDSCTGFFNLVPGYSWCGGAVGMFFILNYYFPIDRSSSALFVAQKTEALSTWWKPLPGPLHRFFSFLFLDILDGGSELYIYFFCWKKIDDVQGLLCLVPASSMERACVRAAIGGRSWFRQCALSPHCVQFSCKHRPPPPHSFSRMRTLTNSPVVLLL